MKIIEIIAVTVMSLALLSCPAVVDPGMMDSEIASTLMGLSSDNTIHKMAVRGDENLQFVFEHKADIENIDNDDENSSDSAGGEIHLVLPPASRIDSITPYFELGKNASVNLSGTLNLGNVQSITVKAEDNTERVYDFTYEIEPVSGTEIKGFMLKEAANPGKLYYNVVGSVAGNNVTVNVPNNAVPPLPASDNYEFIPSFEINGSNVASIESGLTLVNFNPPKTFSVDGNNYTVTVNVEKNSAKDILSFIFDKDDPENSGDITASYTGIITGTNIDISIPNTETITTLKPSISVSPEASVTMPVPPLPAADFTTAQSYIVTAEDGTSQTYTAAVTLTGGPTGPAWVPVGGVYGFSDSTANDLEMDVRPDDDRVVCVYKDSLNSNSSSALIWDGTTWSDLGIRGITGNLVTDISMTIDAGNNVYIAQQLMSDSDINISEYTGSSWLSVPTSIPANIDTPMSDIEATLSAKYVIYRDTTNANQVTVQEYNGATLSALTTAGLTASTSSNPHNFKLTAVGNTLYASYYNDAGDFTMQEYTGSAWIDEGSASFSAVDTNTFFDVADQNGDMYSATVEGGNIIVRKNNGSNVWVQVGNTITDADVSTTPENFIKLEVSYAGDVYLFYRDTAYKPNLVKINAAGTTVIAEGVLAGDLINNDDVAYGSIAVDQNDKVYIAYRDDLNGQKITVLTYE